MASIGDPSLAAAAAAYRCCSWTGTGRSGCSCCWPCVERSSSVLSSESLPLSLSLESDSELELDALSAPPICCKKANPQVSNAPYLTITTTHLFQGGSRLRHGLRGQFMLPARVHVYGHAIAVAIGRRTLLLRRVALMVLLLLCVVVAAIVTTPIVRWLLLLSHWWAEALVHLLALSMAMRRSLPLLANVRGRGRRSEIRLTCRGA